MVGFYFRKQQQGNYFYQEYKVSPLHPVLAGRLTFIFLVIKLFFCSFPFFRHFKLITLVCYFRIQRLYRVLEKMGGIFKTRSGTALSKTHGILKWNGRHG